MDDNDTIIGISSAVSGLLSFMFYRLYRSCSETERKVRESYSHLPVWQPDLKLRNHLEMQDDQCLAYAAVEGKVTDLGRTLRGHYDEKTGVIIRSQIAEHKSKHVNGFWNDTKNVTKDKTEIVPFAIVKQDGDPKLRIEVTDLKRLSLQDELETTYEYFEPSKTGLVQGLWNMWYREKLRGIQETEQMLLTGASVLGVGKVFLEHGQMKIGQPDDSLRSYSIINMRYDPQSRMYKVLAVITACVGISLLIYIISKRARSWFGKRRRLQFGDEIRQLVEEVSRQSSMTNDLDDELQESRDEDNCVVCLSNARQVVAVPCGHLAMCADCAEVLSIPKTCPICRTGVNEFTFIYRP